MRELFTCWADDLEVVLKLWPQGSSSSIFWKLVRNSSSQVPLESYSTKIPRGAFWVSTRPASFSGILTWANHCSMKWVFPKISEIWLLLKRLCFFSSWSPNPLFQESLQFPSILSRVSVCLFLALKADLTNSVLRDLATFNNSHCSLAPSGNHSCSGSWAQLIVSPWEHALFPRVMPSSPGSCPWGCVWVGWGSVHLPIGQQ